MLVLSFLATLGATLLVYLSLPGQRWLEAPARGATGLAGLVLLPVAIWAGAQALSLLSAVFMVLVVVMLALAAFPYLSLLRPEAGE